MATDYLLSNKTNDPPNLPAVREQNVNASWRRVDALHFKPSSVAANTQLPQALKLKLANNKDTVSSIREAPSRKVPHLSAADKGDFRKRDM